MQRHRTQGQLFDVRTCGSGEQQVALLHPPGRHPVTGARLHDPELRWGVVDGDRDHPLVDAHAPWETHLLRDRLREHVPDEVVGASERSRGGGDLDAPIRSSVEEREFCALLLKLWFSISWFWK